MAIERKIKVLHIMPQIGIGGAECQLAQLIANSPPDQVIHEVLYFSGSQDEKGYELYDNLGIKYERIPRNKKRPIKFLLDFAAEIKQRKPDIVHCWLWSGNIWGRWAALIAGVKSVIVAYRNCDLVHAKILWILERFTTRKVHYLGNSKAVAAAIGSKLGVKLEKFKVIYNGIDLDAFEIQPDKQKFKSENNLPSDKKIVTMVGRLMHQKNYPMFIKIAELAKKKNLQVHFIAAGCGNEELQLRKMVDELDLNDVFSFLGLRRDIPYVLKNSDVFCFTTLFEGFPNALVEAMAAGLPIVTTDFAGHEELIENNENGKVVAINNAETACDAITSYIEEPKVAEDFGRKAKESVNKKLSISKMVGATLDYYKDLLND